MSDHFESFPMMCARPASSTVIRRSVIGLVARGAKDQFQEGDHGRLTEQLLRFEGYSITRVTSP